MSENFDILKIGKALREASRARQRRTPEAPEIPEAISDNLELWNEILGLFGADEARERFENLCGKYREWLVKNRVRAGMQTIEVTEKGRADIHNKIMDTIYRLMNQADLTPEQRKKFRCLSDRKRVAEMIDDALGPYSPAEKEKIERMTPLGRFRKGDFN